MLLMNIALCNDVVVVQTKNGTEYHGSSTDEITLLDMAKRCGYEMIRRVNDNIYLKTPGSSEEVMYRVIQKFEFNSDRKRMSVIVEMPSRHAHENKEYIIFTKGADTMMFELED